MSCHESNDRLDSIRLFETVATESGRSIPLNVPLPASPKPPVPTSLGLTFSGFETATRKDAALEAATDSVLTGSTNAGHSGDDEAAERSA